MKTVTIATTAPMQAVSDEVAKAEHSLQGAIEAIQNRVTTDVRCEDSITAIYLEPVGVEWMLTVEANDDGFLASDIAKACERLLEKAGLKGVPLQVSMVIGGER
jgi:hypothetical protein